MIKTSLTVLIALLILACVQPALSQPANNVNLAMSIAQARQKNSAMMKQYSWNCRTEVIKDGTVKDIRIDAVNYGPDGNIQRTILNDQSANLPIGFFRRAIAESEKKQAEEYLTGLRGVLDQYTLPTAGKILDFISSSTVNSTTGPNGGPILQMNGNSVINPGDTLALSVDPVNMQTRRMQITTTYQGSVVNVTATFKTSPSGLNYMSFAQVDVPDKGMTLQVQNYDYVPNV